MCSLQQTAGKPRKLDLMAVRSTTRFFAATVACPLRCRCSLHRRKAPLRRLVPRTPSRPQQAPCTPAKPASGFVLLRRTISSVSRVTPLPSPLRRHPLPRQSSAAPTTLLSRRDAWRSVESNPDTEYFHQRRETIRSHSPARHQIAQAVQAAAVRAAAVPAAAIMPRRMSDADDELPRAASTR